MEMEATLKIESELSAKVIRKDGTVEELGVLQDNRIRAKIARWIAKHPRLGALFMGVIVLLLSRYGAFYAVGALVGGIVTTVGVNYMASDFASGGVTPTISGFKFHVSGIGTGAAVVGDTVSTFTAPSPDPGRVSGTPTNPSANQYRSVATIPYTGTNAITEWGLCSASSAGTLWDRRVFSAINVASGDSIQFTYTLTVPSGGS